MKELTMKLLEKGCLMRSTDSMPAGQTPILILENLHSTSVSSVFGGLLSAIEHRGPNCPVKLDIGEGPESFFLLESCYIIGTMDKTK